MKSLKEILERKDDTMVTLEPWADYILIDIGKDIIEYLEFAEVEDADVKKLKLGESLIKDETKIYCCITDTSAIEEK